MTVFIGVVSDVPLFKITFCSRSCYFFDGIWAAAFILSTAPPAKAFLALISIFPAPIAPAFLAFGPWQKSAFLAEKAIGALFGFAIKIIVLVLILSAAIPVLSEFTMPANFSLASFGAAFRMAAAACCVALLCWQAPGVASSMMGGSPSLSAGGAVGTAAGAIFGAVGAGKMLMAAKNTLTGGGAVDKIRAATSMPSKK